MMNLNEMTSKQLKELGKEHGVKNWWNLSKAALIAALTEIEKPESEQVNVKAESEEMPHIETENNVGGTLIETPAPETIVAYVEVEEPQLKKPNLRIHEVTFEGRTQSIRAWAEELEMPWPTLYDRINRNGWTVEEALTIPLGGRRKK